jgi:ATP synthase protein I
MDENDEAEEKEQAALRARLDKLAGALEAQRECVESAEGARTAPPSSMTQAYGAAGQFAAAIVVGAAIGWGLDRLFATRPLFLIVFLLLGAVSGALGLIRATTPKPPTG